MNSNVRETDVSVKEEDAAGVTGAMEIVMNEFKKACVYQIYPRSFYDTSGNGVGDLKGVTEKLDYIRLLGVDYIWLTPFFVSPQNDNGYDIEDYYGIDPLFGTMAELEELILEAKKRGIGLMFDMVFNHTSTQHVWFQKALKGDPRYQNYYVFREGRPGEPPTNWQSKFGGSAWEYVEDLGQYYLHLFDRTQADLNWDQPEVREEMKNVIRFWKNKGIRGFRFDVVNLISKPAVLEDDEEGDGRRFYTDGPRVHEYLRELVEDTGLDAEDIITVGEMSSTTMDHCLRYTRPEEKQLRMCFNFHHLKVDYRDGDKWALMPYDFQKLKKLLHTWQKGMADGNGWNAVFWCNHDQPRAVSRFGNDVTYREKSAKMLATVIHGMRGTPYIYQGEELGMTNAYDTSIEQYRDVESIHYYEILKGQGVPEEELLEILRQRSRDNARTPMQWNDGPGAGFTEGTPWIGINRNYKEINAQQNIEDSQSVFHYYRKLIGLRKEYMVISEGMYEPISVTEEGIFAYKRTWKNQQMIVAANFTENTVTVRLPESPAGWRILLSNEKEAWDEAFRSQAGEGEKGSPMMSLQAYGAVMIYTDC